MALPRAPYRRRSADRHHLIGRLPAGQGRKTSAPGVDYGILGGNIEAGFRVGVIDLTGHREVHDAGRFAQHERLIGKMLVGDLARAFHARAEEREDGGMDGLRRQTVLEAMHGVVVGEL